MVWGDMGKSVRQEEVSAGRHVNGGARPAKAVDNKARDTQAVIQLPACPLVTFFPIPFLPTYPKPAIISMSISYF